MEDALAAVYQQMLSAHEVTYGEPASVKMRHYLRGQAEALVRDLGITSKRVSQREGAEGLFDAPVEDMWAHERKGGGAPERRWRPVQILRSKPLPLGDFR